nr:MAG TPA: hypothetical protein [Caudoviricetes sp.]
MLILELSECFEFEKTENYLRDQKLFYEKMIFFMANKSQGLALDHIS